MRDIGINKLLVLCLALLFFTGCMINRVKPETVIGNLENQEDIYQSSNNSQSSSTGLVEEPVIEDTEEPGTVYPQQWATGDGTAGNPWANNCIQKAYDFVPDGGTIFLKAGYYTLSTTLNIGRQVNLIGESRNNTIIVTSMTTTDGIIVAEDYCTLKGFTIDGTSQINRTLGISAIGIYNHDYILVEDIEVKNGGYYGMNIYQVNHSVFQNIYTHNNYWEGMHPGSDTVGRNKYNTYRDIYAWGNGQCGFADRGNSTVPEEANNVYDNIQGWDNGKYGISIAHQKNGVLSNSFASGNGEFGILLWYVENFDVHDCSTTLNLLEGLYIWGSENVNLTNVIIKNSPLNIAGISIHNSSELVFTSCESYDDRATPLQSFGLSLSGTNTGISLLNCKLMPNKEGDIYDPNGVAVEVITDSKDTQISPTYPKS